MRCKRDKVMLEFDTFIQSCIDKYTACGKCETIVFICIIVSKMVVMSLIVRNV